MSLLRECIFIIVIISFCWAYEVSEDEPVTCGSVIKLENIQSGSRLHSHDIKYGSGSGQQSVTGMHDSGDVNSHWQIIGRMLMLLLIKRILAINQDCKRGEAVKCGLKIRLMHLSTRCFLHSHLVPAPLSQGEGSDTGDHFKVLCTEDIWTQKDDIRLKHEDTGKYLAISGQKYSRPISGQMEIVGIGSANSHEALWRTAEGIYIKSNIEM